MAMALTVLLRIFSGGVRNVAVSADYAKAVLIAESRLATAGIDDTLAPGDRRLDKAVRKLLASGAGAGAAFWSRLFLFVLIAIYGTAAVAVFDAFWPAPARGPDR